MIETGKITNFILLIKEELRENMGGILAMVLGVLAALYTIWLTLTYLPAEPYPSVVTPTPITAAPSYLLPTAALDIFNPTPTASSSSMQEHLDMRQTTPPDEFLAMSSGYLWHRISF